MYQMIIRLTDEEKEKVDYLCDIFNESKTSFIRSLINAQYDNVVGNPELSKMLNQMAEIGRTVEEMTGRRAPDFDFEKIAKSE